MTQPLILFLLAFCLAFLLAFPLGKTLKRHAGWFYLAAVLLVVGFVACRTYNMGGPVFRWFAPLIQKGYLATVLLGIVMFTGVLDEGSSLRKRLQPIRGELSVISSILYCGHLATYATAFLPRLGMTIQFQPLLGTAIVVAIPLTCVFVVLSVTSLRNIKSLIPSGVWRGIQKFSYVMVALIAVHVAFALGRSAFDGSPVARISLFVYIATIVVYAILRIRKALRDKTS